ncbi:MAG: ABC transporter permease [Candidatus Binataceae bacterium]|jgi:ABC-2 type transport system permease protein
MRLANIWNLGIKELRSLAHDVVMIVLIIYAFSLSVYSVAKAMPETLSDVPIAIVDEDQSQLSARIVDAFFPPQFMQPALISRDQMDARMDAGSETFAVDIPPDFERDVMAGRNPKVQLNVDATRMHQAFTGGAYIQNILAGEIDAFVKRYQAAGTQPAAGYPRYGRGISAGAFAGRSTESEDWPERGIEVPDLTLNTRFNPNLERFWFGAVVEIVNEITMLSIVLTGAALIREREHGTVEHLLVMPVTPFEIMTSKIWSMALVVLAVSAFSLVFLVRGVMSVPIQGSVALFLAGAAVELFATTSLGMFLATFARSMPQFGLLMILVLIPLVLLSGGFTPYESMPEPVQIVMLAAPTTHLVTLAEAILFRGAGFSLVWKPFAALAVIGSVLFGIALTRFRSTITFMA